MDIISVLKEAMSFRQRSSRSFDEEIMSKDKYPSIFFKSNGNKCVYYPSKIYRNAKIEIENWGYINNSLHLAEIYSDI